RDVAARAAELEARLERALDEAHPPASVDDALARYLAFYAIWAGELSPLIAAARAATVRGGARPSSIEAILGAAARGELREADVIEQLGAVAPAWDVAVATYGERPGVLRDAIARAASVPRSAGAIDLAADLAERDDRLFARAQRLVRRALLARGAELGLDGDDVFWLPLAELAPPLDPDSAALRTAARPGGAGAIDPNSAVLRTAARPGGAGAIDPDDAHRRASAARAAAARAARWQMPVVVGGPPATPRTALRGVGTGPRVTGRVVRFASLASAIAVGAGDVVVARAVTPALAVLVVGCAALVSETGNLLDHGAALARELGIPCVVGCHDAWSQLADGMLVTVDGDGGVVSRP
ncbi:MAG: PEP-utilizing enzyme, partial [Acidobacteriota bacterium]